jgi:hypothetical protein
MVAHAYDRQMRSRDDSVGLAIAAVLLLVLLAASEIQKSNHRAWASELSHGEQNGD